MNLRTPLEQDEHFARANLTGTRAGRPLRRGSIFERDNDFMGRRVRWYRYFLRFFVPQSVHQPHLTCVPRQFVQVTRSRVAFPRPPLLRATPGPGRSVPTLPSPSLRSGLPRVSSSPSYTRAKSNAPRPRSFPSLRGGRRRGDG